MCLCLMKEQERWELLTGVTEQICNVMFILSKYLRKQRKVLIFTLNLGLFSTQIPVGAYSSAS